MHYIRTGGEILIPDDEILIEELIQESEFYILPDLVTLLKKRSKKPIGNFFNETTLINEEQANILNRWCQNPTQKWTLLYKVIYYN